MLLLPLGYHFTPDAIKGLIKDTVSGDSKGNIRAFDYNFRTIEALMGTFGDVCHRRFLERQLLEAFIIRMLILLWRGEK